MFADIITTEAQLRAVIGHPSHRVMAKHVAALDQHCRDFIARSPFLLIASGERRGIDGCVAEGRPAWLRPCA